MYHLDRKEGESAYKKLSSQTVDMVLFLAVGHVGLNFDWPSTPRKIAEIRVLFGPSFGATPTWCKQDTKSFPGGQTAIKSKGVSITTLICPRDFIIQIGSTIPLMRETSLGKGKQRIP